MIHSPHFNLYLAFFFRECIARRSSIQFSVTQQRNEQHRTTAVLNRLSRLCHSVWAPPHLLRGRGRFFPPIRSPALTNPFLQHCRMIKAWDAWIPLCSRFCKSPSAFTRRRSRQQESVGSRGSLGHCSLPFVIAPSERDGPLVRSAPTKWCSKFLSDVAWKRGLRTRLRLWTFPTFI
jgi:hypothetical protein